VTRDIEWYLDDLSNWYVRRSRRRFWKSENDDDKMAAYTTLYICLETLCKLIAPIVPFLAEKIYRNIVYSADAPASVHLCEYPSADPDLENSDLIAEMDIVKKAVEMGRSIRNKVQLKVRQPLAEIFVLAAHEGDDNILKNYQEMILEELNIKKLSVFHDPSELVSEKIKLKYNVLGKKYGKSIKKIEAFIKSTTVENIITVLKRGETCEIDEVVHEGKPVALNPEDVIIEMEEPENLAIAEDGPYKVAVDTFITPELKEEGTAREFVRAIQNMRKEMQFEVTDHISISYKGPGHVINAVESNSEYIMKETLALKLMANEKSDNGEKQKIGKDEVFILIKKMN